MHNSSLGVPVSNHKNLITLLVDQNISNKALNECRDVSKNANINILSFGDYLQKVTPRLGINPYVVTDLNSAVEAVISYYNFR